MLKIFSQLKKYKFFLLAVVFFLFVSAICDLLLPYFMSNIVNNGVAQQNTQIIVMFGFRMLGIALLSAISHIAANYLSSKVAMSFGRDLRTQTFKKVMHYSLNEVDKIGTSSLITRNTNDIQQIQMLSMFALRMMVSAPLMVIGGILMAVSKDPVLSITFAVALPVLTLIIMANIKWVTPLFIQIQAKLDRVNQVFREKLSGVRVIRAFNREERERARFDEANRDLTETSLMAFRRMAVMNPLTMITMNAVTIAVLFFGSFRVTGGNMLPGDLMAFIQYATQIMFSLMMATMLLTMLPRAAVSAKRINEVLELDIDIREPEHPASPLPGIHGTVRFEHVTFRYPGADEPVLRDISFETKPGETIAIIGSTGSGKSTLINLLPRFYDVTEGTIFLDGVDIRQMRQEDLRSRIGFVPQKAVLFTGTISENIRYGKEDATDEEVRQAAETAQATEFIDAMPEQFDAYLSQDATNISGGQKQRISIARALIKNPEIYIFDDSFSALDFRTDAKLRQALKPYTRQSTVMIVAQRVSTVMSADRIIVLDNGEMVGIGKHSELIKTCEVYRQIVSSQLSEEELA